jgi:hypothetical protein
MWKNHPVKERKIRENETYFVSYESMSQLLKTISTDSIVAQIQCDQCLCGKMNVQMKKRQRVYKTPCYFRKHAPVVELLRHRFHSAIDPVKPLSVRDGEDVKTRSKGYNETHCLVFKSASQMLDTFVTDFILSQVQCG